MNKVILLRNPLIGAKIGFLTAFLLSLVESIYITFEYKYIFLGVFDKLSFLLSSSVLYGIVGAILGFVLAFIISSILPKKFLIKKNFTNLFTSSFIGILLILFFGFQVNRKIFFLIQQRNFIIPIFYSLLIIFIGIILMFILYKVFKRINLRRISTKRNLIILTIVFLLIIIPIYGISNTSSIKQDKPNIILISFDTLRADHVSSYGYEKETTPNIDLFASEGVLFEEAYSQSILSVPTHTTVFTSLYPGVHNVNSFNKRLDDKRETLADILKENGYITFGISQQLSPEVGFGKGIDFYENRPRISIYDKLFLFSLKRIFIKENFAEQVTGWTNQILEANKDQRFFIFIHYVDIHSTFEGLPYHAPEEFNIFSDYSGNFNGCGENLCATRYLLEINKKMDNGEEIPLNEEDLEYIKSLYDGSIRFTDFQFGKLLDKLKELNLEDNTLIIIFGDHGEEFLEHNHFIHNQPYDENVHIPLIFKYSELDSLRIETQVRLIDVAPTILDIINIEKGDEMQGISLLGVINGSINDLIVYNECLDVTCRNQPTFIRTKEYKFIKRFKTNNLSPWEAEKEFYDLINDPEEKTNIINHEKAREFEEALDNFLEKNKLYEESLPKTGEESNLELSPDVIEELRRLGYEIR